MKIRIKKVEDAIEFVKICDHYISDVNIYYGSLTFDAKSLVAVLSVCYNDSLTVKMVSPDKKEIERFENDIKKFEVKEV